MRKIETRLAWLILAVALAMALPAPAARAQGDSVQGLINRIDRLQRELITLQRAYYQGKPPPKSASGAAPAAQARPSRGGLDKRMAARLEIRLTELETEIRKLTGKTEELQHAVGQFDSRFSKLVSDVDLRLRALEQAGSQPATASAEPAPGVTPQPPASLATQRPRTSLAPNSPAQTLGTIPARSPGQNAALSPPAQPAAAPAQPALPAGTPKQQYDNAISLMLNDQNFAGAEHALKTFIERHPEHELTGNAHYWLGETFYVRKDFRQAAFTFADGYQRFPKNHKAPDNLLKLGMALGQLGQAKEACTAFSRLLTNFPNLGDTLKSRIQRQRQRHQCR
jgi:tol-pal system protein YbgF